MNNCSSIPCVLIIIIIKNYNSFFVLLKILKPSFACALIIFTSFLSACVHFLTLIFIQNRVHLIRFSQKFMFRFLTFMPISYKMSFQCCQGMPLNYIFIKFLWRSWKMYEFIEIRGKIYKCNFFQICGGLSPLTTGMFNHIFGKKKKRFLFKNMNLYKFEVQFINIYSTFWWTLLASVYGTWGSGSSFRKRYFWSTLDAADGSGAMFIWKDFPVYAEHAYMLPWAAGAQAGDSCGKKFIWSKETGACIALLVYAAIGGRNPD